MSFKCRTNHFAKIIVRPELGPSLFRGNPSHLLRIVRPKVIMEAFKRSAGPLSSFTMSTTGIERIYILFLLLFLLLASMGLRRGFEGAYVVEMKNFTVAFNESSEKTGL